MGVFTMPSLGADMDRGTVVEWRVAPGDHVERGDIVAEVETEKSNVEVEVFESGVIEELLVKPGVEVEVGTPLATLTPNEGAVAAPVARPSAAPAAAAAAAAAGAPAGHEPQQHHVVSPIVRHLAERLGVDTDAVPATGAGAVVTRSDVEAAAARTAPVGPARTAPTVPDRPLTPAPPVAPAGPRRPAPSRRPPRLAPSPGRASPLARRLAAERKVPVASLRGTGPAGAVVARDVPAGPRPARGTEALKASVAALMARSKREVPHYYLRTTVDLGRVRQWLDRVNADRPPAERILPAAVLLWAIARAAVTNPGLNGHWVDGGFRPADGVDLGIAVSLRGGGLLAPRIGHAEQLDAEQLMSRLRDLTERARHGGLKASEMGDPTITVTNLGDAGVEEVYPVIYPPQVAMVGLGKVVERPWVVDGLVVVRPVVTVTLAGDHRATNGHDGARFLSTVDRLLQDPEEPWTAPVPTTSS
jgi:pyruvate dehydrogenase E2 component (dihydrolipoamide acetyltransferase)